MAKVTVFNPFTSQLLLVPSGASPGGSTGDLQYNNSGSLAGDTATTDGTGNITASSVTAGTLATSKVQIDGVGVATIQLPSGLATSYEFNLPVDGGTSGYLLTSSGGTHNTNMTWTNPTTIVPTNVPVTATSANATFYPTLITGDTTGNYPLDVSTSLSFVPSSGVLSSTTFLASTQVQTPHLILTGAIDVLGSSSGDITINAQSAAGTYNFNLPNTAGNSGQVLTSQGGLTSAMNWTTPTTGTVTSVSVSTANGVSGTVATSTTTPAITLTLGAITPSSVASSGAVSGTTGTFSGMSTSGVVLNSSAGLLSSSGGALAPANGGTGATIDLAPGSFVTTNNQAVAANVTGLAFANATVRGFRALVTVYINATSSLYECFTLQGIQRAADWQMAVTSVGDNSAVVFSITTAGQIQYTSGNSAGFVAGVIKYRAVANPV